VITIKKTDADANTDFAKSQTHYAAATRQLNSVFANMDLQLGNSPAVPVLDVTFTDTVAMCVARQAHRPPFLFRLQPLNFIRISFLCLCMRQCVRGERKHDYGQFEMAPMNNANCL